MITLRCQGKKHAGLRTRTGDSLLLSYDWGLVQNAVFSRM